MTLEGLIRFQCPCGRGQDEQVIAWSDGPSQEGLSSMQNLLIIDSIDPIPEDH